MKLTAQALLEKKGLIEERKREHFMMEVDGLGTFTFRLPSVEDALDAEAYQNGTCADEYLVAACCVEPAFNDPALVEGFGVSNAVDVVRAIFLPGVVKDLATKLVRRAGYEAGMVHVVDDVKNA